MNDSIEQLDPKKTKMGDLLDKMAVFGIPDHCRYPLARYIVYHTQPGDFLASLLKNDLRETCAHADHFNIDRIYNYVKFLYNEAPGACWGSKERFEEWLQAK